MISSPVSSLSTSKNGCPKVVRCPAIAELPSCPGSRRLRIVPRSLLEVVLLDAGHHDLVDADPSASRCGRSGRPRRREAALRRRRHPAPWWRQRCPAAPTRWGSCRRPVSVGHGVDDHRGRRSSSCRRAAPRIRSRASSGLGRSRCRCPTAGRRRSRTCRSPVAISVLPRPPTHHRQSCGGAGRSNLRTLARSWRVGEPTSDTAIETTAVAATADRGPRVGEHFTT